MPRVSIPYEREGAFRLFREDMGRRKAGGHSFNSLRAGRGIQTGLIVRFFSLEMFQFPTSGKGHSDKKPSTAPNFQKRKFQFPTSGKGHSDMFLMAVTPILWLEFQFPTSGKGHSDPMMGSLHSPNRYDSFNSLRAGRGIQTRGGSTRSARRRQLGFQFPTSGKGHSDLCLALLTIRGAKSFNSLRAGRGIQT